MTAEGDDPQGFLSHGFRPFFLAAALWAVLAMALWMAMLWGWIALPSAFDALTWHAHEALFGYLGAVLAGFLLTAVPTWTGRPPLAGWPLLVLFSLWLLGRVAVAGSEYLAVWAVAALDLAGPVVLCAYVLREIVIGRNWRNLVVVALIAVFVAGNALFHLEAAGAGAASGYGLRTGLAAAIALISLIGGRIVPAFTRNWLTARGAAGLPAAFGRSDALALALTLAGLAAWVGLPEAQASGYLLLAAGLTQAWRMSRWRGAETAGEPLVWVLHLGYAFVPLGMLAMGGTILLPELLPAASAQHLWMAGAVGVMTLAVMTRATLGHSGRPLTVGAGTVALYLLVAASVVARLLGGALPEAAMALWTLSAALWCLGFAGFLVLYSPLLLGRAEKGRNAPV